MLKCSYTFINILTDFCVLIMIAENSSSLLKLSMQLYRNESKRAEKPKCRKEMEV